MKQHSEKQQYICDIKLTWNFGKEKSSKQKKKKVRTRDTHFIDLKKKGSPLFHSLKIFFTLHKHLSKLNLGQKGPASMT